MNYNKLLFTLLFAGLSLTNFAQEGNFSFRKQLENAPDRKTAFCVANDEGTLQRLLSDKNILVKRVTPEYIYIQATPLWINDAKQSGKISWFHFETGLPQPLADTVRAKHFVDQVHNGQFGLQAGFTGKDVVIGYIDQGLDYTHPDFIDENGQTRVLYYWDHTLGYDPDHTPAEYGYGQVWDSTEIQNGTSTSTENYTAHGTTVAGMGSGNGRANGTNKGMAPDSKIIIVETDLTLPNWTLTVADACDFIFAKAEELGLPAVVNLSVGDYLGSHDGNDPASILMEAMLDEAPGRIIVCAAGNSGALGKYHVHNEVDSDTSFTWFRNNPSGAFGQNTVYFDLWSDADEAGWQYAIAAHRNSGDFSQRASTVFRNAAFSEGTPVFDTLWNGPNRIATLQLYPEIIGGNYHLEVYLSYIDSTDYNYSFKTTGTGSYDLWSGAGLGLNTIVTNVPPAAILPSIVHYVQPDALQSIVSSWNCSEKVISVGNIRNRFGHVDNNGNYWQQAPGGAAVGQLSFNSSKGPNRHNVIKPDVSAGGDGSLSAGPLWLLSDPAYNSLIDSGGYHVRNGGTSMASPVIAGIAALYLEKCRLANYQGFIDAVHSTSVADSFTNVTPNNGYGYGKVHALALMLQSNYDLSVSGPSQFCQEEVDLSAESTEPIASWNWNTGASGESITVSQAGSYSVTTYSESGCIAWSDTFNLVQGDIPPTPVITLSGNQLMTASYPMLQWYENGTAIPGAMGSSISVTLPLTSEYTVIATGMTGCTSVSEPYGATTGISEAGQAAFLKVYPNPAETQVTISSAIAYNEWKLTDMQGKELVSGDGNTAVIRLDSLSAGTYILRVVYSDNIQLVKIVKN